MRKIKFRAWDTQTERMYTDIGGGSEEHRFTVNDQLARYQEGGLWDVMQWTGLQDKNGKEIYENDIVRAGTENVLYNYCVEWFDDKAGFHLTRPLENGYPSDLPFTRVNHGEGGMEVIGNVYETPDLI